MVKAVGLFRCRVGINGEDVEFWVDRSSTNALVDGVNQDDYGDIIQEAWLTISETQQRLNEGVNLNRELDIMKCCRIFSSMISKICSYGLIAQTIC